MPDIQPRQLILDLLIAGRGQCLPVAALLRALKIFDISPNSGRVAVTRLAATKLLQIADRGLYRLGPKALPLARLSGAWRVREGSVRPWKGEWVGVATTGLLAGARGQRVYLQALNLSGFREYVPGLHLRPNNLTGGITGMANQLNALTQIRAQVFGMHDLSESVADLAARLWDVKTLEQRYNSTRLRLDELGIRLRRGITGEAAKIRAAREALQLGREAIRLITIDPLLPPNMIDVVARHEMIASMLDLDGQGRPLWFDVLGLREAASTL